MLQATNTQRTPKAGRHLPGTLDNSGEDYTRWQRRRRQNDVRRGGGGDSNGSDGAAARNFTVHAQKKGENGRTCPELYTHLLH
jgi:hypothetical protein